ncbi:putative oxidoreductase [Chryseolinea serpens]|uniref:Putative oxidoreductase n=1 Tax=Chryseolinea serpens TaxID=947013 RepID=A0A1M5NG95_9BACT|nr:DoxX family protein [Chryseolinea serpens]SHG87993.1 putative oxidoreductase [Chryseolinea serpens]
MKELLFNTQNDWTGFILRITVGAIMFPHGAQKLLGLFGGYGYNATMNFFAETLKLPALISFLVIVIEFFGAVGLIAGFASKLWALLLICIMTGAIVTTNYKNGFFMNWFQNQAGEGYEYHLLVIGMCLALLLTGSGAFSLDGLIKTPR